MKGRSDNRWTVEENDHLVSIDNGQTERIDKDKCEKFENE